MSVTRVTTDNPEQTVRLGQRMGERLAASAQGGVVLWVGPLGAGKTVLAKGIALGLGVQEPVVSPTYTIVSQYPAGRRTLHHVDLYRIEGREQLENLGLEDILAGDDVVVVEWGEKLEPSLAGPYTRVTIGLMDGGGRDIVVEEKSGGPGTAAEERRGSGDSGVQQRWTRERSG